MFKMSHAMCIATLACTAALTLGAPALAAPGYRVETMASRTVASGKKCPMPAKCPVSVVSQNFAIKGMFCEECARHISESVRKLPGIKSVQVDYETGKGQISYVKGKVDPATIIQAIKKAGYTAKPAV